MHRVIAAAWLAFAILAAPRLAPADTYAPFRNFRKVDATGRYYVVVKKADGVPRDPGRGTPVNFEFAERADGSPPVTEVYDEYDASAWKRARCERVRTRKSLPPWRSKIAARSIVLLSSRPS